MKGFVTHGPRQSLTSFRSSLPEFRAEGVSLELFHFEHLFWRRPLRALRSDSHAAGALERGGYDFAILNSGASLLMRPRLLSRLLAAGHSAGVPMFVLWRNAAVKFEEVRRIAGSAYGKSIDSLRDPGITHLAISETTARDVSLELGVPTPLCVYNCQRVDPGILEPVYPEDPPIVLNVGSVIPRKDPMLFIRIARRVCSAHPTVRFVWVGGEATEELKQAISGNGLDGRVVFVPFTDDPISYMRKASLFLLTSSQEAFGLVLAEAMACSRTVMCVDGTGAAEVAGPTGWTFDPGDMEAVCRQVLQVIERPAEARVNVAARDRYLREYSPSAYARRFVSVLKKKIRPDPSKSSASGA